MSLYGLVLGAVLAELSSPGIRELPTSPGEYGSPRTAARLFGVARRCCPWRPVGRGSIYLCKFGMAGFCTDPDSAQIQGRGQRLAVNSRAGHTSHNAIAGQLNVRKVATARGGRWTQQVGQILERAAK